MAEEAELSLGLRGEVKLGERGGSWAGGEEEEELVLRAGGKDSWVISSWGCSLRSVTDPLALATQEGEEGETEMPRREEVEDEGDMMGSMLEEEEESEEEEEEVDLVLLIGDR